MICVHLTNANEVPEGGVVEWSVAVLISTVHICIHFQQLSRGRWEEVMADDITREFEGYCHCPNTMYMYICRYTR